jgi:hypothetical protein
MNIFLKSPKIFIRDYCWRSDGIQKAAFNSWFWVDFLFPLGECDLLGSELKGLTGAVSNKETELAAGEKFLPPF